MSEERTDAELGPDFLTDIGIALFQFINDAQLQNRRSTRIIK